MPSMPSWCSYHRALLTNCLADRHVHQGSNLHTFSDMVCVSHEPMMASFRL